MNADGKTSVAYGVLFDKTANTCMSRLSIMLHRPSELTYSCSRSTEWHAQGGKTAKEGNKRPIMILCVLRLGLTSEST